MKKAAGFLSTFLKIGALICTFALLATVILQVYARFFMSSAPAWTEEASRIFFIYAISFAAGSAYKQNYYVSLDLISGRLGSEVERIIRNIAEGAVFLLFFIMMIFSIEFIRIGLTETSPSLGFNMSLAFGSMFFLSFSISFFSGMRIIQRFINKP